MSRLLRMLAFRWSYRCSVVLWGIFLYPYVMLLSRQSFSGHEWFEPMVPVVHLAMAAVMIVEIMVPFHALYRLLLEVVIVAGGLMLHPNFALTGQSGDVTVLAELLGIQVVRPTPHLWYGLATAAIYWSVCIWPATKARIWFILLSSLVLFSIMDTLNKDYYYWLEISILLASGLLLVIVRHFGDFQSRHPYSWRQITKRPRLIFFPVFLFLALILLVTSSAPETRPFLTDPYTAWMMMHGKEVKKIGASAGQERDGQGGKNSGNGLDPESYSTGNFLSGYSRSEQVLGGGFQFDPTPVMRIHTTQANYYRGEVRSVYTGRGWEPAPWDDWQFSEPVHPGIGFSHEGNNLVNLKTKTVTQTVTMLTDQTFPVLFGAHFIDRVESINNGQGREFSTALWLNHQQVLRWLGDGTHAYPRTYTITSQVPVIDEEALRQASAHFDLPVLEKDAYLQLPGTIPERVKGLAREVTAAADNDYDKLKMLEQFLKTNYSYNHLPDLSKSVSSDFVDNFLFGIREGYCDHFSTAFVVMARSLGLPARWVKGFSTGTVDSLMPGFPPSGEQGAGVYVVRNADAHSWAEVYFAGYGWIPFEPTPNFSLPNHAGDSRYDIPDLAAVAPPANDAGTRRDDWQQWATIATAAIVAGFLFWRVRQSIRDGWHRLLEQVLRKYTRDGRARIAHDFHRFLRYAERKGYRRKPSETARETLSRWSGQLAASAADFEALLVLFEQTQYGNRPVTDAESAEFRQLVNKLRAAMK